MSEPTTREDDKQKQPVFNLGTAFGRAIHDPVKPGQIAPPIQQSHIGEDFTLLKFMSDYRFDPAVRQVFEYIQKTVFRNSTQGYPEITPRIFYWATGLGVESAQELLEEDSTVETLIPIQRPVLEELLTQELASPAAITSRNSTLRVSLEMHEVAHLASAFAVKATGKPTISLRHFLAMIMKFRNPAEYLLFQRNGIDAYSLLSEYAKNPGGDNEDVWKEEINAVRAKPPAPVPFTAGNKLRMNRIAEEHEIALQADKYAEIIKDFFIATKNDGEMCFALYGHWGRGKSFLMGHVAKNLQREKYAPVHFSAWKYPNAPEVWVHLYETVADAACNTNFFLKVPRIVRAGIEKNGAWPLLSALTLFAVGLVPKIYSLEKGVAWGVALGGLIGLGGFIWLVEFFLGVIHTKKRLANNFLTATRHAEKLGLQATIGKDLKALFKGWIPQGIPSMGAVVASLYYGAIVSLAGWSTWHWFGFGPPITDPHPILQFWATTGIVIVGILLFVWVVVRIGHPQRVLLIVDDLDRCAPTQLLSVMESVKLMLDDDEINRRVQVAMLIEEDVLHHALKQKYGALGFQEDRMLRENKEKLFNVHLRMGQLSDDDVSDLLERIVARKRITENAKHQNRLRELNKEMKDWKDVMSRLSEDELKLVTDTAIDRVEEISAAVGKREAAGNKFTEEQSRLDEQAKLLRLLNEGRWRPAADQSSLLQDYKLSDSEFDEREEKAFRECVPQLRNGELAQTFGPRSIRAFVFRYQLARLILIKLNIRWSPEELVDELVRAATGNRSGEVRGISEDLKAVIRQVS